MKKFAVAVLVAAVVLLASCTTVTPVAGATGKVGAKVGMAKAVWYLSPVLASGDIGIAAAAKAGGISSVGTVDLKHENMFLMGTYTTIVTGE